MDVPFDHETLAAAQREVVRENKLESCYLRPIIWVGSEKLGVSAKGNTIHVAIAAWPWGAYLGEDGLAKGIRVKTSSFTRHHVNVSMVRAKASGWYVNSILANQEAIADGYDEALLLDVDGYVSEGSGENFFLVNNGKLYTPDLSSCLDGITRDTVITLARDCGHRSDRKAHHARRGLHLRRSVLHRHRRRSHADPRTRQPHHRLGRARPDHGEAAKRLLRHRERQEREVRALADQDLNRELQQARRRRRACALSPHEEEIPMSEIKEMPLVELSAKDLPAYCPNPSMPRWSAHPRVFIDVTHGEARCPYCGTRYKLRDGEVVKGH